MAKAQEVFVAQITVERDNAKRHARRKAADDRRRQAQAAESFDLWGAVLSIFSSEEKASDVRKGDSSPAYDNFSDRSNGRTGCNFYPHTRKAHQVVNLFAEELRAEELDEFAEVSIAHEPFIDIYLSIHESINFFLCFLCFPSYLTDLSLFSYICPGHGVHPA